MTKSFQILNYVFLTRLDKCFYTENIPQIKCKILLPNYRDGYGLVWLIHWISIKSDAHPLKAMITLFQIAIWCLSLHHVVLMFDQELSSTMVCKFGNILFLWYNFARSITLKPLKSLVTRADMPTYVLSWFTVHGPDSEGPRFV